jgi:isopentenyl diphosphate isomerase/L-lactate dehydrogenase-like FMN-dependent dehydrogenase
MKAITATLTKVLHAYGDLEIQETMRFPDTKHAMEFSLTMLGKRVSRPVAGSAYTITAVEF